MQDQCMKHTFTLFRQYFLLISYCYEQVQDNTPPALWVHNMSKYWCYNTKFSQKPLDERKKRIKLTFQRIERPSFHCWWRNPGYALNHQKITRDFSWNGNASMHQPPYGQFISFCLEFNLRYFFCCCFGLVLLTFPFFSSFLGKDTRRKSRGT